MDLLDQLKKAQSEISNYVVPGGQGNCFKCMSLNIDGQQNIYAKKDPKCYPLLLNLFGTQYDEWEIANLADGAEAEQCYSQNPENYAEQAGVDAINCYGVARYNWECDDICPTDVDKNQLKLNQTITLPANSACQYKVNESYEPVEREAFYLEKTTPDLKLWVHDRPVMKGELRADEKLNHLFELEVWDEVSND